MTNPDRPNPFADSLAELEARIAAADAGGEPVPSEARQMLEKLRDLISALGGLSATLGDLAAQLPETEPPLPEAEPPLSSPIDEAEGAR
jgi:hypothetical protein